MALRTFRDPIEVSIHRSGSATIETPHGLIRVQPDPFWGEDVHIKLTFVDAPKGEPIQSLGNRNYQIGNRTQVVEENEDDVLQVFFEKVEPGWAGWLSLDKPTLAIRSGHDRAATILKKLADKYDGCFASSIKCPGKRGNGGLKVCVDKRQTAP